MTIGNVNYALPGGSGTSLNVADLTPNTSNPCDAIKLDRLLPEDTRHSAYLNLQQELTDSLSFYVQGLYSKREFSTFRSHPVLNIANVPATNPFRPADVPAATAIRVQTSLVPDVGRGRSSGTAKNYDVAAGLEWKVGDFRVRATGSHGEGEDEEIRILVDTYQLNQALADPNPATAFNPFAGPGFNNPATLAKIFSDRAVIAGTSTITAYDVDVDGPLFALPGGQVRIAAGAEYREEGLDTYTVRAVAATGLPGVTIQDNDRNIRAVFGELYVPVVGAANAVPGIQALNLSLAVRYEDYSDFGSTTNPKVGLSWETGGGVTLRGSYGTSFRAPGLSENDPLSGGNLLQGPTRTTLANGQVIYTVTFGGGRADLKPEEATTWTAGFDFEPESLSNFKLGVTYFDVEYKNQIVDGVGRGALYYNNPAAFPEQVGFQGTPQFDVLRGVIERFGYTPTAPIDYSQPDLVLVDLRRANVGSVKANGLDLTARYSLDLASAGQLSFGLFATRFLDYTTRDGRQPEVRRLNRISYPAKFAGRALVGWDRAGVETQLAINYTNSYLNDLSLLVPTVDSYTTVDLDVGYRFDEGFLRDSRIAVNVRNLFDEEPSRVDRASAYDPSKASAVGRVISLSVSKRW
jgi:iron complex outermembrane receptor protein